MVRLFLARHGQTEWNTAFRMQGRMDSPLTALGVRQTMALGQALRHEPLSEIYCSPAGRAVATAEMAASHHPGLEVKVDDDLAEMDLGPWEGLTREEIKARWPSEVDAFWNHPEQFGSVGGEDYFTLEKRLHGWMARTLPNWTSGTRLVVSHGVTLQMLFALFGGGGVADIHRERVLQQCGLSLYEWEPGQPPKLMYRNKVDHLPLSE